MLFVFEDKKISAGISQKEFNIKFDGDKISFAWLNKKAAIDTKKITCFCTYCQWKKEEKDELENITS